MVNSERLPCWYHLISSLLIDITWCRWPQTNRTEGGKGSGSERRAGVQKMKGGWPKRCRRWNWRGSSGRQTQRGKWRKEKLHSLHLHSQAHAYLHHNESLIRWPHTCVWMDRAGGLDRWAFSLISSGDTPWRHAVKFAWEMRPTSSLCD